MHKLAVIGSRGLIGQELMKFLNPTVTFNSDNIDTISHYDIDTLICAAPSGDRRLADANTGQDTASVGNLIAALSSASVNTVILISTIDTVCYPESVYGKNRLDLEQFVQDYFVDSYVVRLCSLIGNAIKKNVLYDLKHQQYVKKINLSSELQWYPLDCLEKDLHMIRQQGLRDITLASEPIGNQAIVEKFFKTVPMVGTDPVPVKKYNVTPYYYSTTEIFKYIDHYVNS
jgi:hypothetical protein